jgi:tetratricopeptide (TPR) repeat protein
MRFRAFVARLSSSLVILLCFAHAPAVSAQENLGANERSAGEAVAPVELPPVPPAVTAAVAPSSTASKADALLLYKQGRDLETAGKLADAQAKYRASVSVCDKELAADPTRMDAYTVKCWSLFRLERYREVVDIGAAGLKVKFDARIVEVMGEAYFHLNDDGRAVKSLQRYLDNVGEYGDRVPSAYFYMAESYMRQKRLDHADIAYSIAVYREPGIARWWYRYASLKEQLGDYGRAVELYGKALRLSPGMTEAINGQARAKARL